MGVGPRNHRHSASSLWLPAPLGAPWGKSLSQMCPQLAQSSSNYRCEPHLSSNGRPGPLSPLSLDTHSLVPLPPRLRPESTCFTATTQLSWQEFGLGAEMTRSPPPHPHTHEGEFLQSQRCLQFKHRLGAQATGYLKGTWCIRLSWIR